MTLDEILASLFGTSHGLGGDGPVVAGRARLADGTGIHVLGFTGAAELGVDDAVRLAGRVLAIAGDADETPILFWSIPAASA